MSVEMKAGGGMRDGKIKKKEKGKEIMRNQRKTRGKIRNSGRDKRLEVKVKRGIRWIQSFEPATLMQLHFAAICWKTNKQTNKQKIAYHMAWTETGLKTWTLPTVDTLKPLWRQRETHRLEQHNFQQNGSFCQLASRAVSQSPCGAVRGSR